jgi:hypothetical protein
MKLRYTGGGYGGFVVGIPARDLLAEEVEKFGGLEVLLATGLYKEIAKPTKKKAKEDEPKSDE